MRGGRRLTPEELAARPTAEAETTAVGVIAASPHVCARRLLPLEVHQTLLVVVHLFQVPTIEDHLLLFIFFY